MNFENGLLKNGGNLYVLSSDTKKLIYGVEGM